MARPFHIPSTLIAQSRETAGHGSLNFAAFFLLRDDRRRFVLLRDGRGRCVAVRGGSLRDSGPKRLRRDRGKDLILSKRLCRILLGGSMLVLHRGKDMSALLLNGVRIGVAFNRQAGRNADLQFGPGIVRWQLSGGHRDLGKLGRALGFADLGVASLGNFWDGAYRSIDDRDPS